MNTGLLFYYRGEVRKSWLTSVDARVRIIAGLLTVVLISVTLGVFPYLMLTATLLAVTICLRFRWSELGKLLIPFLIMTLLTLLLHLIFNRSGKTVITTLLGLPIKKEALEVGLLFSWRVALFLIAALCLTRLISPEDFAEGIWRLLAPSRKLKLPAQEIGMAFLIAVRFIPMIFDQYHQIKFAQTARGASFSGGLVYRIRRTVPLLVPVTAAAIRQSDILADALVVRGWGVTAHRTYYNHRAVRISDYLVLLAVLVWAGLIIGISV